MAVWWEDFEELKAQLNRIEGSLESIKIRLGALRRQENQMAIDLTAATAEIAKNTSVSASAVLAINTLIAQLAAIPPSNDAATQAALDNIVANWQANDASVGAAVANTNPAAPVPPVVVVPPTA